MANRILLTGTEFTHIFSAPLSKDMSDLIFNNDEIQKNKQLRDIVWNRDRYEDIYQEVIQSVKYGDSIKLLLNVAIK